jgi:8-oxo-dGTP pyrophosphatase MutT (NUDIX family)
MSFSLPIALAEFQRRVVGVDATVAAFRALADGADADPYGRGGNHGHFTGSALVLSRDGGRTLLTLHRKLGLWLQPGGHADGDHDLCRVALREAAEETGLPGLVIAPQIFDLDRHWIPARTQEPGHWHYDLRFLVHATGSEDPIISAESNDLRWWPLAEVAAGDFEPSLRRMAQLALERSTAAPASQPL